MSRANQGKEYEKQVQDYLRKLAAKHADFDWLRLPDARTSMGRIGKMPADFEIFSTHGHGLVEVKSIDHAFRLPHAKLTQIPKMKVRAMAGGFCIVITYFKKTKTWRGFQVTEETKNLKSGSYDFREYFEYDTLEDILADFDVYQMKQLRKYK